MKKHRSGPLQGVGRGQGLIESDRDMEDDDEEMNELDMTDAIAAAIKAEDEEGALDDGQIEIIAKAAAAAGLLSPESSEQILNSAAFEE
jgi:hypothetical protein